MKGTIRDENQHQGRGGKPKGKLKRTPVLKSRSNRFFVSLCYDPLSSILSESRHLIHPFVSIVPTFTPQRHGLELGTRGVLTLLEGGISPTRYPHHLPTHSHHRLPPPFLFPNSLPLLPTLSHFLLLSIVCHCKPFHPPSGVCILPCSRVVDPALILDRQGKSAVEITTPHDPINPPFTSSISLRPSPPARSPTNPFLSSNDLLRHHPLAACIPLPAPRSAPDRLVPAVVCWLETTACQQRVCVCVAQALQDPAVVTIELPIIEPPFHHT